MNDNPVMLAETLIRLNVSENTPIGTTLTRINATDRDIGLNGEVMGRCLSSQSQSRSLLSFD